ncbi:MAG TPA: hypothetical protein VKU83_03405 [Puia sp.]|nr:hypothetical protein [Puia sp.]
MKKIKWTIMTLAVIVSISAAVGFRPKPVLSGLYYYNGTAYLPAGTEGVNYVCLSSTDVCTYILQNGVYTPYETASSYQPINLAPPAEPSARKAK